MSRLTLYKDNLTESTIVSNQFIDEYMKDANDAQIKVYLYLLRLSNNKSVYFHITKSKSNLLK